MSGDAIRLAKRVAEMLPCSRAEAERYIAGGWVSVDGEVVEEPAMRVTDGQDVLLLPGASSEEAPPVTILLHKPAGLVAGAGAQAPAAIECITAANQAQESHAPQRFLRRHLVRLSLVTPLETGASGLVVYTQDFRVARKLVDDADRVEQEYVVEVSGQIREGGLALLNHGLSFRGRAIAPMKVSWQSENRLRFAGKGLVPGQVEHMCGAVGLSVQRVKRLRVGRLPLAGLPEGQWRFLLSYERF